MEMQINRTLTDKQQFRYELLQWCGNAEKAEAFIMGGDDNPVQAQPHESSELEDGVYLVHANGKLTRFIGEATEPDGSEVEAIGLKMGGLGIKIALHDEVKDRGISLTTRNNTFYGEEKYFYIEDLDTAVVDMTGEENTYHLRNILNPEIQPDGDWYIPSLGEMYHIFINKKAINTALRYVGGGELREIQYWTSTETCTSNAWQLSLGNGSASWGAYGRDKGAVRLVSAFNTDIL